MRVALRYGRAASRDLDEGRPTQGERVVAVGVAGGVGVGVGGAGGVGVGVGVEVGVEVEEAGAKPGGSSTDCV